MQIAVTAERLEVAGKKEVSHCNRDICIQPGNLTKRAVGAEEPGVALAELDGVAVPVLVLHAQAVAGERFRWIIVGSAV
jgi:hypothetical protein